MPLIPDYRLQLDAIALENERKSIDEGARGCRNGVSLIINILRFLVDSR
jgi:hypothetical protein